MARAIKRPEDIFGEIKKDFQNAFCTDLVSIILYGSGASGNYIVGTSDLNFLIILRETGSDDLERAFGVYRKWRKSRVAPVFMTEDYITASVDSYPVEFLNMKLHYIVVFGKDVLAGLTFQPCDLRLQLERELKGKVFHLRKGFLESEGREKDIRQLIRLSLGSIIPLFKAILFLGGCDVPPERREVIKSLSQVFFINTDVFLRAVDIKEDIRRLPAGETRRFFKSYYEEIVKLSACVDCMSIDSSPL